MKIAVASNNGKNVNLHFGDASNVLIFEVNGNQVNFVELREKPRKPIKDHSDRWIQSLELVSDCQVVLCSRIGLEPKEALQNKGIEAIGSQKEVRDAIKDYLSR
ncbi:MAG: nitrogen fixation protein [Methanobacterium sp.]|uniref:NifB/NifX family molybdenum-iron cluster-binding protein n=1 Tax=Methanobacterium sp. TaxID=2164 RepID=UPI003D6629C8|nr:nitrogen fixation protein [Methanobacterium sp.]